ncbi:MAG: LysR substrate-binding domain-containing protein [Rubrivivax sp.]|nr:LysR substrate-binding domain-containing protein [Rubrivivax sp.]
MYSTVQGDGRWCFVGSGGQAVQVGVHGPLRTNNLSALLSATRAGMGPAALPGYVAHASVNDGAVVPVLQQWGCQRRKSRRSFLRPDWCRAR